MLDHALHSGILSAAEISLFTVPPQSAGPGSCWLTPGQFLAPLHHAIVSCHYRSHQDGNQVIIRFKNGYGAVISTYRLRKDVYEILPLLFHGPGSDNYEFHFRSHVPDLSWCAGYDEMLEVCGQISRLMPAVRV
jgi:hypothetical protein